MRYVLLPNVVVGNVVLPGRAVVITMMMMMMMMLVTTCVMNDSQLVMAFQPVAHDHARPSRMPSSSSSAPVSGLVDTGDNNNNADANDTAAAGTRSHDHRDMASLESWAERNGVLKAKDLVFTEKDGDWSVVLRTNGDNTTNATTTVTSSQQPQQRVVLHIPSELILSSSTIRKQEPELMLALHEALDYLTQKKLHKQINQFLLWIKLLQEYELHQQHHDDPSQTVTSLWSPWFDSLPTTFSTAIAMDEVELACLPPFAYALAKIERVHLDAFLAALQMTNSGDVLSPETRQDTKVLHWAFNVVFTRCWGSADINDEEDEEDRKDIVPMGDMFNHGHPGNVYVEYDADENCQLIFKQQEEQQHLADGQDLALHLSYGLETNPYRYLVVFGFVDVHQQTIYSQFLAKHPTSRHVDLGYDVAKMTFNTTDGSFTEAVWDFLLYACVLEQIPTVQAQYYTAHQTHDTITLTKLRQHYYLETCLVFKTHLDTTLRELHALRVQIDQHLQEEDPHQHKLLPLIRRNNLFVTATFLKVKHRIDTMIQQELWARKAVAAAATSATTPSSSSIRANTTKTTMTTTTTDDSADA